MQDFPSILYIRDPNNFLTKRQQHPRINEKFSLTNNSNLHHSQVVDSGNAAQRARSEHAWYERERRLRITNKGRLVKLVFGEKEKSVNSSSKKEKSVGSSSNKDQLRKKRDEHSGESREREDDRYFKKNGHLKYRESGLITVKYLPIDIIVTKEHCLRTVPLKRKGGVNLDGKWITVNSDNDYDTLGEFDRDEIHDLITTSLHRE